MVQAHFSVSALCKSQCTFAESTDETRAFLFISNSSVLSIWQCSFLVKDTKNSKFLKIKWKCCFAKLHEPSPGTQVMLASC